MEGFGGHGGASASRPGSREPSPSVSAASGFDPSRLAEFKPASYEGKPRWLPKPDKRLLRSFVDPLHQRVRAMTRKERQAFIRACLQVSPINCGWDEYAIAKLLFGTAVYDETVAEVEEPCDSDGSGEAGETALAGSTEGDSAGRSEAEASPNHD